MSSAPRIATMRAIERMRPLLLAGATVAARSGLWLIAVVCTPVTSLHDRSRWDEARTLEVVGRQCGHSQPIREVQVAPRSGVRTMRWQDVTQHPLPQGA